jgi:RNA-directed DNA polymerase
MDLASLLFELKPLLGEPQKNLTAITRLLEAHTDLAEYEVARYVVAQKLIPDVEERVRSVDPRERRAGLAAVGALFPRSLASKVVRHLVKDPDTGVRGAARAVHVRLGLHETALRDTRYKVPNPSWGPWAQGGWNSSGWFFGTRRPKPPKKPPASVHVKKIADVAALAKLLELKSPDELTPLARPGTGPGAPYVSFTIPKAKGGLRTITAPRAPLKKVQRIILREILDPLPLHPACHGFVKKRSTVTNATPHARAKLIVKTDLRDFFPTLHYGRVIGFFTQLGYSNEVAAALTRLTTHRPVLSDGRVAWPGIVPQGAPTSPALANLVCRRLDERLTGLARKAGATYTRYADDLTFSFAEEPTVNLGRLFWWIDQICQQEGFAEHTGKRRIMRPSGQQRVTGLVTNAGVNVPRAARRRFRAILHNCKKNGIASEAKGRPDFAAYLRGFAAYVTMVQPELGRRYAAEVEAILKSGGTDA